MLTNTGVKHIVYFPSRHNKTLNVVQANHPSLNNVLKCLVRVKLGLCKVKLMCP